MATKSMTMLKGFIISSGKEYAVTSYTQLSDSEHARKWLVTVQNTLNSAYCPVAFKRDWNSDGGRLFVIARARAGTAQQVLAMASLDMVLLCAENLDPARWSGAVGVSVSTLFHESVSMTDNTIARVSSRIVNVRLDRNGKLVAYGKVGV